MNDDTDVLTLLRTAAVHDAPALTLQVDDLVRTGRRRRLATRAVSAGVGMALVAGAFAVATTSGENGAAPGPAPADNVTQSPDTSSDEYTAHMMPALLKDVVLSEFPVATPDWKTFDLAAYGIVKGRDSGIPLPEPLWDKASQWTLKGTTDDHGVDLRLVAGDFGGTEGAPEEACRSLLADGLALSCTHEVLADGRVVVTSWERDVQGGGFATAGLGGPWFIQAVKVYREGSGYVISLRQGVQASSLEQAQVDAWLDDAAMLRIALSPDLELEDVLRYPSSAEGDAVSATENQSP